MIPRRLEPVLRRAARHAPVVAVIGPRQSGKTTLVRHTFPQKPYASLEDPDTREYALRDPRGFLHQYARSGAVLDEVQRVPALLSYLQSHVDASQRPGQFILTGSHHLLLLQHVSQTLAGRVRLLTLLPLSVEELPSAIRAKQSLERMLVTGGYPRLYAQRVAPRDWYPDYVQTYLERDVRQLKNVTDLLTFQRFLKLCAGRTACPMNLSALAQDCGVTHNTARAWLSVLEASFLLFLVPPYHRNFNKRLVKMPKMYFYDTGLACTLLGIAQSKQLETHPLRGSLFETFVVAELMKHRLHRGQAPNLAFWRDKTGHEIDCLIEEGTSAIPVEIQLGRTVTEESLKNLRYWQRITDQTRRPGLLVFGGEAEQRRGPIRIIPWRGLAVFPEK